MFKTGSYQTLLRLFVLSSVFLAILVSLGLPSLPEPDFVDDEEVGVNLMQKELKEYCENPDPEMEHLEEIDLFAEDIMALEMPYSCGSGGDFLHPVHQLPDNGSDIRIPPPKSLMA